MSVALLLIALASAQYDLPVVPEPELAEQRGGFRLPNGIDVAMTVQTQTAVNGAVVLTTVFRADQGPATLTVYTPKPGETVAAGGAGSAGRTGTGAPSITYDSRNGIQVSPGAAAPGISVGTAKPGANGVAAGLGAVDASGGVATDAGTVTQAARDGLRTVELNGANLTVTHFAGNAFGSAIANSGSDRTIDTQTSLSIDLHNAGPDVLGSAMLRATDIADSAVRGRF